MLNFIDNGSDLNTLGEIFKSISFEDLMKAINRAGLVPKRVMARDKRTGKLYTKTVYVKACSDDKFKSYGEGTIPVREIHDPVKFINLLSQAKMTVDKDNKWRVSYNKDPNNYKDCRMFATKHGDVFAVRASGDIISVCKNDNSPRKGAGKALLKTAVALGGKKLDTYDGNFGFYVKCGFKPVSWCKGDAQYMPKDWSGKMEDIIFFEIGECKFKKASEWKKTVAVSKDYDTAEHVRDDNHEDGKE